MSTCRSLRSRLLVVATLGAVLVVLAAAAVAAGAGRDRGGPFASPAPAALDLRYGPRPAQTLDVHVPSVTAVAARRSDSSAAPPTRPAVLLVHGGGWFAGDKSRLTPTAQALAAAGFVVFNVNYTLARRGGRPSFPLQLDELRAALAWTEANAAGYGADRRRIAALGTSAGGNLAALLATTAVPSAAPGAGRLRALVTWSAPLDLTRLPAGDLRRLAATFTGCPRLACTARVKAASPLAHVTSLTPPTLLVNARRELVPLRQAARMADALAHADVAHRLLAVPGTLHGRELAPYALERSLRFLRRHMR